MVAMVVGLAHGITGQLTTGINMALQNKKSLGQHWLKDRSILDELADEAMITTDDPDDAQPLCLEIGPGLGTLTSSLLKRFKKVLAIEYDAKLAQNLPKSFPGKNLEVENADFLQYDLNKINEPYVVAGNIPYYITTPIIEKLIKAENKPLQIMILIQKEVADRITAGPGKKSLLTLEIENLAIAIPGVFVHKNYFTPPPKVDSASVILIPRDKPQVSEDVMKMVRQSFSNPRKKLSHNLPYEKAKLEQTMKELNISENARPAELSLADYEKLYLSLAK